MKTNVPILTICTAKADYIRNGSSIGMENYIYVLIWFLMKHVFMIPYVTRVHGFVCNIFMAPYVTRVLGYLCNTCS